MTGAVRYEKGISDQIIVGVDTHQERHVAVAIDRLGVRLERILVQALEEETTPQAPESLPEGRFARPGSAFSQTNQYRRTA